MEKNLLGFAIWFLISSIIFGFVYQFYPLLGVWDGLSIYVIAIISSGMMFYDYVIYDYQDENDGHYWRYFGHNDHMKKSCEKKMGGHLGKIFEFIENYKTISITI